MFQDRVRKTPVSLTIFVVVLLAPHGVFAQSPLVSSGVENVDSGSGKSLSLVTAHVLLGRINNTAALKEIATAISRIVRPRETLFEMVVEDVSDDGVSIHIAGSTILLHYGDTLLIFQPASAKRSIPPAAPTFLDSVGLISVREALVVGGAAPTTRVVLEDHRTGKTAAIARNEVEFGFFVRETGPTFAVLTNATRVAAESPLVGEKKIPDLIGMSAPDRDRWLAQWRGWLDTLADDDRREARERMRVYWQQQWSGAWGAAVTDAMTPARQESIRDLVASYWR